MFTVSTLLYCGARLLPNTYLIRIYNDNIYSKVLYRTNEFDVTQYGIQGTSVETGCVTDITYFNLDSMPELKQSELKSLPNICYNSNVIIEHDAAVGGSGTKEYQWQYSYDGENFEDEANGASQNLTHKAIKFNTYFRRIAKDMCQADTSNTILVSVNREIPNNIPIEFVDRKCENQNFRAKISDIITPDSLEYGTYTDRYTWYLLDASKVDLSSININTISNAEATFTVSSQNPYSMVSGFKGEAKDYYVITVNNETKCSAEPYLVTAYNATQISSEDNLITTDVVSPCNNEIVTITGDSAVAKGKNAINFVYSWSTSKGERIPIKRLLFPVIR